MKILLIGKTGQLGSSILRLNEDFDFISPSKDQVDLANIGSIENFISTYNPDVIINTAAFHNLPECEGNPNNAFKYNFLAVGNLSLICHKHRKFLITFSTDYVFDGAKNTPYLENDIANPLQIYGLSKLAGELATTKYSPDNSIIIRTCGLYGFTGGASKGGNFVDNRISDAQKNIEIEISADQTVSPTFTDDLALALFKVIRKRKELVGTLHLTNEGECTWAEFTKEIYNQMGFTTNVIGVNRLGMSGSMRRPAYSVLQNTRAKAAGISLPSWQDGLRRFIYSKYLSNE